MLALAADRKPVNRLSQVARHSAGSGTRHGIAPTPGYSVAQPSQRSVGSRRSERTISPPAQHGQHKPATLAGEKGIDRVKAEI